MFKKEFLIHLHHQSQKKIDKILLEDLIVGVAQKDITPPPGLPMSGYSVMANYGQGFRTRLFARAIYIKSKNENPIVIVQCDLLSGSLIVHHKVAELIASKTDILPEGLVMAGTHTHSAPGNYYSNNFFNNHASNSAGFDDQFFNFLTRQISQAVIEAYISAYESVKKKNRKIKIATGYTTVDNISRNRSLDAYRNNKNIESNILDVDAVNNKLFLIRIDAIDEETISTSLKKTGQKNNKKIITKPLAVISSFSLHPNMIAPENKFYNADVFGYIERELEYKIRNEYQLDDSIVHVALNFTHADNDALYQKGVNHGFKEARRLGSQIAEEAFILFESLKRKIQSKVKRKVMVRAHAKELDLFQNNKINNIEICKTPAVGLSQMAGATSRPLPILNKVPYFAPKWPKKNKDDVCSCHKEKRVALGKLQKFILPKEEFPHYAFLQLLQIDDSMLMFLPYEITFETGRRMSNDILEVISTSTIKTGLKKIDKEKIISVSTSNGYFGYVNTEEEYALQFYEGGSNLYGPKTAKFLSEHLKDLLEDIVLERKNNLEEKKIKQQFRLAVKSYFPKEKKYSGKREVIQQPIIKISHEQESKVKERKICFQWLDVPPFNIDFHKPLLKVEVSHDNKKWKLLKIKEHPISDMGLDISIQYLKKYDSDNMAYYEGCWYNYEIDGDKYYRFVVEVRKNQKQLIIPIEI